MNTLKDHSVNEFGLEAEHFGFIVNAIGHYADIDQALIFGSRALGSFKRTSDIDIALKGDLKENTAGSLREFLNNAASFLYNVDVLDFSRLTNEELKKQIESHGKIIYRMEENRVV